MQDLCTENGVSGYPQMNLYRNGEFVETFDKDRDFDIVVNFLSAHAEPSGDSSSLSATAEQEENTVITPAGGLSDETHETDETLVIQTPRAEHNPLGEVISLTSETFDDFVAHAPTFVKFFAPWYICSSIIDHLSLKTLIYKVRTLQETRPNVDTGCSSHAT